MKDSLEDKDVSVPPNNMVFKNASLNDKISQIEYYIPS